MKKVILSICALVMCAQSSQTVAAELDSVKQSQYLSDWWHQSVNVVGSYHTRFAPVKINATYLEYEAFGTTDILDFYGYIDLPNSFGLGNSHATGIWDKGSPFFMEIEPRFSLSGMSGRSLSFGPFKDWYISNNYIYDMGRDRSSRSSTWYMGIGTDIDTGLPINLSANIYAKYQWQNYGASNENTWDGYRFKVKYVVPVGKFLGGDVSYVGFTNIDWGSDLGDDSAVGLNGRKIRTSDSIASSHVIALNYDRLHYSFIARYFHNGGQWAEGAELDFGKGAFKVDTTGWGYYMIVGYNF